MVIKMSEVCKLAWENKIVRIGDIIFVDDILASDCYEDEEFDPENYGRQVVKNPI